MQRRVETCNDEKMNHRSVTTSLYLLPYLIKGKKAYTVQVYDPTALMDTLPYATTYRNDNKRKSS